MGAKLVSYYEEAKKQGGLQAQMRLAVKTGMPDKQAADAPDSPENIKMFEDAMKEIAA